MQYRITKSDRSIKGSITLSGSKSLSNRVLLIEALSGKQIEKENLSDATDTIVLQELLSKISEKKSEVKILDCKDAGTAFRFLTAYCSLTKGEWILTGTERMKERPIRDLVDALKFLGAQISFPEKEGYPPLKISGGMLKGSKVRVNADISSQFISALLMIAPCLPDGLTIELAGDVVSKPYIEMTLHLMNYFGIGSDVADKKITVFPQKYQAKNIFIEADWSAAAFYYEMAAFAIDLDLSLNGLSFPSIQGDAALSNHYKNFGITTIATANTIALSKSKPLGEFHFNLKSSPDLAPAMFATSAGLSIESSFDGLAHLAYKESNREEVMKTELNKCGINVVKSENIISVNGIFQNGDYTFSTYKDHRIAMALAPLAMLCRSVIIEDPEVVRKSYPSYWEDLKKLGFMVEEV